MLYIDMDGVFTNWEDAAIQKVRPEQKTYRGPWGMAKYLGMEEGEFYRHFYDPHWWINLPKTPDCDQIIKIMEQVTVPWRILTDPVAGGAAAAYGKITWWKKHGPQQYASKLVIAENKLELLSASDFLIDDNPIVQGQSRYFWIGRHWESDDRVDRLQKWLRFHNLLKEETYMFLGESVTLVKKGNVLSYVKDKEGRLLTVATSDLA